MNKLTNKTNIPPALPPQRRRFADAILAGTNQTQSALQAGYSTKCASVQADRLLKKDMVKQYITFHQLQIAERNRITQDEIVSGIREVIVRLKKDKKASSAVPLLKGYELLAKMGGFLRDQGIDPDQRPAFVGISITMGNGKIDVTHGGNSGGISKDNKPKKTDIIDIK